MDSTHLVSIFGNSFIRGVQEQNVYACVKHFPGHGNTATDSHTRLPVIYGNKKDFSNAMLTLEQMDEVPLDTLELIIKETLKDYLDTIIFKKMDKNEDVQFGEIDKIKKIFQSCYLGKENTDLLFEELVIKDTEDFSRYIFFYINYLSLIHI